MNEVNNVSRYVSTLMKLQEEFSKSASAWKKLMIISIIFTMIIMIIPGSTWVNLAVSFPFILGCFIRFYRVSKTRDTISSLLSSAYTVNNQVAEEMNIFVNNKYHHV